MGLLSAIYGLGLKCRRYFIKAQRLPFKVISVGNITLGGAGKTPAVIAVAVEAKKRGLTPCILTRGYKGKAKGPCLISKETRGEPAPIPLSGGQGARGEGAVCQPDPYICGDEPALMAERLNDVPIIKCADRYEGGEFAISNLKSQISNLIFILDDGFQHWSLYRDIDVLLIDATNPFGNERLFPEGRLREPLASMKRAHIIVITKADIADNKLVEELAGKIRQYNPEAPLFTASHKPASFVTASGETTNTAVLRNKKVFAFAGVANPSYFKDSLTSLGADIKAFKPFRDHYIYKQSDIDKIITEAQGLEIITTEKDMVKLKGLRLPGNLSALRIEFVIDGGFYDIIFKDI